MFKLLVVLVAVSAVWGLPHRAGRLFQKFGRSIPGGRIEGGKDADIADYPYQLALVWYELQICSASIIGSKWALTSAYCTINEQPSELSVLAGSTDLSGGQLIQVAAVHLHPQFNEDIDNDISVLKLAEDVTTEHRSPIVLHDSGYWAEEGADATIAGWGSARFIGIPSQVLQVVVTKVVSNEVCNEAYRGIITNSMVCAGNWEEGGEGACDTDWGSALVVDGKQYGIASGSHSCAKPHWPFISTRVSEGSMREFVRNITGI